MDLFFIVAGIALFFLLLRLLYQAGVSDGRRAEERDAAEKARALDAEAEAEDAFPEPDEEPEDPEPDVCLRPGTRVKCYLSDVTHTHGILLGFTIGQPGGSMLAIVDVGDGAPAMPIDVDRVDPDGDSGGGGGTYRTNASRDSKHWN